MKRTVQAIASLLLLITGAAAVYGGSHLIAFPDGSSLQLPAGFLQHTPFSDYLIPGIILFAVLGLFSLFVFAATIFQTKNSSMLISLQGTLITGWILIQMIMLQMVFFLHVVFLLTGILLMFLGWLSEKSKWNFHLIT